MRGQERGGDGGGGEPEERGKEEREVERSGAQEDVGARNVCARTYPASWGRSSPLRVRAGRSSGGPGTNFPGVRFLILEEAETGEMGEGEGKPAPATRPDCPPAQVFWPLLSPPPPFPRWENKSRSLLPHPVRELKESPALPTRRDGPEA